MIKFIDKYRENLENNIVTEEMMQDMCEFVLSCENELQADILDDIEELYYNLFLYIYNPEKRPQTSMTFIDIEGGIGVIKSYDSYYDLFKLIDDLDDIIIKYYDNIKMDFLMRYDIIIDKEFDYNKYNLRNLLNDKKLYKILKEYESDPKVIEAVYEMKLKLELE